MLQISSGLRPGMSVAMSDKYVALRSAPPPSVGYDDTSKGDPTCPQRPDRRRTDPVVARRIA